MTLEDFENLKKEGLLQICREPDGKFFAYSQQPFTKLFQVRKMFMKKIGETKYVPLEKGDYYSQVKCFLERLQEEDETYLDVNSHCFEDHIPEKKSISSRYDSEFPFTFYKVKYNLNGFYDALEFPLKVFGTVLLLYSLPYWFLFVYVNINPHKFPVKEETRIDSIYDIVQDSLKRDLAKRIDSLNLSNTLKKERLQKTYELKFDSLWQNYEKSQK